jgi:hypothetical protein
VDGVRFFIFIQPSDPQTTVIAMVHRKRLLTRIVLLPVAMLLGACSSHNVLFNPAIQRAATQPSLQCDSGRVDFTDTRVVRAYFDRDGDLYPGPAVGVLLDNTLFNGPTEPLKQSFKRHRANPSTPWSHLADSLEINTGDSERAWVDIQDSIRRRVVTAVNSATHTGARPRVLVVLVHGFNVDDAECSYRVVREQAAALLPEAAYLLVNWDGLVSTAPIPMIWSRAQFNFPLVGMGLRRLLSELDSIMPVRILTHSSGGPVVAHALWDASGAEGPTKHGDTWPAYVALHELRRTGQLPRVPMFTDLQIGMIVPATPASIFNHFDLGEHGPTRIVIGTNPHDYAVNKTVLPCTIGGNTCLGSRVSYACAVRRKFAGNKHTQLLLFDFSESQVNQRKWMLYDEHDWTVYLRRDDAPAFLRATLLHDAVHDEGTRTCVP